MATGVACGATIGQGGRTTASGESITRRRCSLGTGGRRAACRGGGCFGGNLTKT